MMDRVDRHNFLGRASPLDLCSAVNAELQYGSEKYPYKVAVSQVTKHELMDDM